MLFIVKVQLWIPDSLKMSTLPVKFKYSWI